MGISKFWEALLLFNLLISLIFDHFSIVNFMKSKFWVFLFFFYHNNTRMVFIFQNCLKNWMLTFSKLGLRSSHSGIFKFFTIFEKNLFSSPAVLDSLLINSPFLLRPIFSLFIDLSDKRSLTVFQNFLFICYVLLI